ncbi:MAG: hypothetical protein ACK52S_19935 [Pirellula sp.]
MNAKQTANQFVNPSIGFRASRRQWLKSLIACGACGTLGVFGRPTGAATMELYPFEDGTAGSSLETYRIRSVLELTGEVRLKAQGAVANRKNGKQIVARTAKVTSTSTLDYDEQYRLGVGDTESAGAQYYHEATSEITVDQHTTKTVLREPCREIVKLGTASGLVTAAPANPLFAAERDLIEGSLTTMYLDQLLTDQEVAIADKWTVDDAMACRLLNLDAIHQGKLTVCLVDMDKEKAQLELKAELTASVRDVATELVIDGKAVMDRQSGYISWLAMQIDETREIGEAEPGFKIQAQLRVLRAPIESMTSNRGLTEVLRDVPSVEAASLLQFQSDLGFYRFLADRRWSTYRDNGEEATLRFIVKNRLVAQCNVNNLVDMEAGSQLSLEGYQADIQRLMVNTGGEILEASEKLTSTMHRMLRIVAAGSVEGVPIRWVHYHLSNDQGRRLAMAFTFDEESLDVFSDQDMQIVNSLELMAWPSKLDPKALEESTVVAEPNKSASNGSPSSTKK